MLRRLLLTLGNWLREPDVGDRVVLLNPAVLDTGEVPKGAIGVVVHRSWASDPNQPIATVLMDGNHPALAPWHNRLHVWAHPGKHGSITWQQFRTLISP